MADQAELLARCVRTVDRIEFKLEAMQSRLDAFEAQLQQHHEFLFVGNGTDSVSTFMRLHRENVERLEEIRALVAARSWDVIKLAVSAVVGGLVSGLLFWLREAIQGGAGGAAP